ncbi:MAG: transposase [Rhizobacter sp.]|nr:transposase [Chlorobiales bacterium]
MSLVESGQAVSRVAKALGVSETVIYRWRSRRGKTTDAGSSASGTPANGASPGSVVKGSGKHEASAVQRLMEENRRLGERLRQSETERDILKKALGIFSQSS